MRKTIASWIAAIGVLALEAAEAFSAGVRRPFTILSDK